MPLAQPVIPVALIVMAVVASSCLAAAALGVEILQPAGADSEPRADETVRVLHKVIPMVLNLAPADQIGDDGSRELNGASGIAIFQTGTHTYAAVASYSDNGVQILNVTDPRDITATDQINNNSSLELNAARSITTFQIGSHTYAAVASFSDNGVQILDVTDPRDITATDQISDGGNLELGGASGIATFQIGNHTYAAVASLGDNGVQILNVTDPSDIAATDQINDNSSLELSGASGIATFQIGNHTYAAVASLGDSGVQILNVTDPTDITATDQIRDGGNLELGGASGIATFQIGNHTYAAVAAGSDDGVQILNVTDPTDIAATDQISDGGSRLLDDPRGIATFQIGTHTYAAVTSDDDDGVQILNVTDPTDIAATDQISDGGSRKLDGARDITTFLAGGQIYAAVASFRDDGVQILQLTADRPPNTRPTVDAGPARTIHEGGTFTISGATAADGDAAGTVLTYSWSAPDGSGVTFADPAVLLPAVTAPAVDSDTDVTLTLTVDDQSGTATATATDTVVLTVRETSNHFVTTWATASDNDSITIPGTGTYSVIWGDGTSSDSASGDAKHTYVTSGTYTVSITGDLDAIHLIDNSASAQKLRSIEQWGGIEWTTMESAFRSASSMVYNATDAPDLSGVTNMNGMFQEATAFNGNLSLWDVSKVTDMGYMFRDASSFDGDISSWDVSKVIHMDNMFFRAADFNQDLNDWDVSQVEGMNRMFQQAATFNQPLSGWNVSQVTDMSDMFNGATSFVQNLGNWYVVPEDTAYGISEGTLNVTTMSAQNSILDGHSPTYDIGSGGESALFNMTGNVLKFKDTPSVVNHTVNVTASGSDIFGDKNSWRMLEITVAGADNNPPVVVAGADQTVGEGDTVTLSGSATDPDADDTIESYSWSAPPGITFADSSSASTTFTAPAVKAETTFTLTLTASDGTNSGSDDIVVTVKETGSAFITTWETTDADERITIPGAGEYSVIWGDGTSSEESGTARHTYATSGTYTVSITGGLKEIYFDDDLTNAKKLQSIEQWGGIGWTTMEFAFWGAANMEYHATDEPDLSGVTDMNHMFRGADDFNGDLSSWDVSGVTYMESMFNGATSFNGDLSSWDVSNVISMSGMFYGAAAFNGNVSSWDVSNVTSMSGMFYGAAAFNGNVSSWDVSNVTSMSGMFYGAAAFNGDVSPWDVSQVTNMDTMFNNATAFNRDLNDWDVLQVTDMNRMFQQAVDFNQPLSRWNVSQVTNMTAMFSGATDFNQDLNDWNVSQVTNMNRMFQQAATFNQPLSGWNVSQVTDMSDMFNGATSFVQNLGNWYVVPEDTAYGISEGTLNVTTVSAQNSVLDGHSPTYDIGSGGESALFNMTGNVLKFKDTPSVGNHTVIVTVSGSLLFGGEGNLRELEITVAGADNNPPVVAAGPDQTVGEGDTVTLSGSATEPDAGDSIESYSWSAPSGSGITFADDSSASTTFTAPAVDADATFTLTLTADDGTDSGSDDIVVTVKETGSAFITTWMTTNDDEEITIPGTGTYSVIWGDGSSDDASSSATHAYDTPGTHTISITGGLEKIRFTFTSPDAPKLQSIEQWGDIEWTTMESAFRGASNMEYRATDAPDLSRVTDMDSMFSFADDFNGDLSSWNVSGVTDMSGMFHGAGDFNGDLSGWDVSSVTKMISMFHNAGEFNKPLSGWDVSQVEDMSNMFTFARSFNRDLNDWNVSQVTDMGAMFQSAGEFNKPLSSWDVSQVTVMTNMFASANSFRQNLGNWYVVPADTAYATSEGTLAVTTVSAQNSVLDGHSFTYGIGSEGDPDLFAMDENVLKFKDAPSVGNHTVIVTTLGSLAFGGEGNWRELEITVADDTPPVITIIGDDPLTIQVGSKYTDPGYTRTDDTDDAKDTRCALDTSSLDVDTPGTYTVTYTCTDLSGNQGTATRTVIVAGPVVIDITPTGNIDNDSSLELSGAAGIATFKIGDDTYAAVAAFSDDGVQILNVTDPTDITATDSIDDSDGSLELDSAFGIATFKIGDSTYAAVTSNVDDGVQILDVTDPTDITATGSIDDSDGSLELDGAGGIAIFGNDTHTYAAVTGYEDGGVQILDVTDPTAITSTGSIDDSDGSLELDGASGIATFKIGTGTYAAVAAFSDDGVQILNVTDPTAITATDSIDDSDGSLELDGASGIATFKIGTGTYAAVAASTDLGVQILDVTDPTAITATDSIDDSDSLELDGAGGIAIFGNSTHTYAAVSALFDDGVQILNVTDPTAITATDSIDDSDGSLELNGASGIATFKIGTGTYAAVAAQYDHGVQVLRLADADPDNNPPVVVAGSDLVLAEGASLALSGNATDQDAGDTLEYSWSQNPTTPAVGFSDDTSLTPTITAPYVESITLITLTLTVNDGTVDVTDEMDITVRDTAGAFITTWRTTTANDEITIPGTGEYSVIWGDGSSDDVTDSASHTYATPGTHTISITGGLEKIRLGGNLVNAHKLQSIEQWGDIGWTTMESAFHSAGNMKYNAADEPDLSGVTDMGSMFRLANDFNGDLSLWNVSQVTDMGSMFRSASDFNGNLSLWNVSQVTDMGSMFRSASDFNQPLSSWNVSKVTDMSSMFYEALAFNGNLSSWNVSQVDDMSGMFYEALAFNGNLSSWDASAVTDMGDMFNGASDFNQPLSSWDVSQVDDMSGMFQIATSFNGNVSSWDVSRVTDMNVMFQGASDFNQDLSSWNVSQVDDMSGMFYGATAFNQDLNDWDVSQVDDMASMFLGATSFDQNLGNWYVVPADTAYDTSEGTLNVTTISAQNVHLDGHSPTYGIGSGGDSALFDMTGNVLTFKATPPVGNHTVIVTASGGGVFENGNNWRELEITVAGETADPDRPFVTTWKTTAANETITIPGTGTYDVSWGDVTYDSNVSGSTTHTYAEPGNYTVSITGDLEGFSLDGNSANAPKLQSIEQWGGIEWTTMESAFNGAFNMVYNAADAPDLSRVTDMSSMFQVAAAFNGNISSWDVSKVTDMGAMFSGATSFNQDLNGWSVSQVTDMPFMFNDAAAFNQPLSSWDVSQVTGMSAMFRDATFFNQPLSSWNVSQVTGMDGMFQEADAFDQDLNDWSVSQVTHMGNMFTGATSFNGDLSSWNVSQVTNMDNMFNGASSFNGNVSSWNVSQVTYMDFMFNSATSFDGDLSSWNVSQVTYMTSMFNGATSFDQNLGNWYVVPEDTAYAASDVSLNVTTVSAQNSVLDGHSPTYGTGSGGDSALFNMTGSTLMFEATPSAGSHTVNVTASGSGVFENGNNWRMLEITVAGETADDTPPAIIIIGSSELTITAGTTYTEQGATCTDDTDPAPTVTTSGTVDTSNPGTYTVTYTCTDLSGNAGTAVRTVTVVAAGTPIDTTYPAITLNGPSTLTITAGTAYTERGATCTDETDGPLQVTTIGTANTDTPGTYHITYACTDSSGNESTATRQVRVVAAWSPEDNNPPRANAGPDQTVGEGDTVALSGSAADPDAGDAIESYSWSAPPGSGITFADGSSASTTFTAPAVEAETTFTLTLTAGDGTDSGSDDVDVTVRDTGSAFITTWRTASAGETITIPGSGTYSVIWGDGEFSGGVSGHVSHEYGTPGTHTVSITGGLGWINLGDNFANAQKLQSIEQWGGIKWVTMVDSFKGAFNMVYNADDAPDLSGVADMTGMFRRASSFNGDLSSWDVSKVADMSGMFTSATAFDGNVSSWDVSSVTDMFIMFTSASSFNGDLSSWDVSSATGMGHMFLAANSFQQNLGNWYVVPEDTAYGISEGTLSVTTVSAQNSVLDGHSPEYGIGSGGESALFNMTGDALMFKDAPPVGRHPVNVTASGSGVFGDGNSWRMLEIAVAGTGTDTTPPTITLDGANPLTIPAGSAYADPGYSCADDTDAVGDLRLELNDSGLDVNTPGTYTVTYTCTDLSGNMATDTRTVTVAAAADTIPPIITLDGPTAVTVTAGTAFDDPGVTCTDETDPNPSLDFDIVDIDLNTPGDYTVTYTCTDSSGNDATAVTWTVTVIAMDAEPPEADTTDPVITIIGDDRLTITVGSTYEDAGATCTDETDGSLPVTTDSTVNISMQGTYTITYTCTDLSNNTGIDTRIVEVVAAGPPADTTPPTITINGDDRLTITVGSTYEDAGATCTDETDGSLPVTTDSTVNISMQGTYTITYTCTDLSNNTGIDTRTVTVVAAETPADTTDPVITIDGSSELTITAGTTYTERGATCTDETDGSLQVTTDGTVDTSNPGTYTVTYTCTDLSGNMATDTRTVTVVAAETPADTTDPVITIDGSSELTITAGTTYTEQGATCTDDTDPAPTVTTSGTVDTSRPGTYTVTYTCTDSSGNGSTISRTVTVVDTTDPVIIINGSSELTIQAGSTYEDAGATCTDETDGSPQVTTTGAVDASAPGTYAVTYTCTDSSGNNATADRIVFVRAADTVDDTKAPEIDITGESFVRLHVGDTYVEMGARCVDDTDGTWDAGIHKSTVNTSEVGSYIVIYECTDSSGNASLVIRNVEVAAPDKNLPPVITLNGDSEVTVPVGSAYVDPGATCADPEDDSLEVTVRGGNPDTSSAGKRHIHYTCMDSDGETDSVVRTVIVQ